jgi:hypothetical protein
MLLDRSAHVQGHHGFQQQGKSRATGDLVGTIGCIEVEGQKTLRTLAYRRRTQTHAVETDVCRRSFPYASHFGEHRDDAFE